MSINVACSVPGCTNPVIGQCTGYKKNCGRYYCHEHSSDTLCAECTSRKSADVRADVIYQDYANAAKQIEIQASREFWQAFFGRKSNKKWAIGFLAGLILAILGLAASNVGGTVETAAYLVAILGGVLCVISEFALLSMLITRNRWMRENEEAQATKVEESKPGFQKFFVAWKEKKNQEQLVKILTVMGVIAAIGLATTSESEYDRVRRAVRDEMKRN